MGTTESRTEGSYYFPRSDAEKDKIRNQREKIIQIFTNDQKSHSTLEIARFINGPTGKRNEVKDTLILMGDREEITIAQRSNNGNIRLIITPFNDRLTWNLVEKRRRECRIKLVY